ncbi:diguanylate cyclase [Alteromonas sp. 5E99-2]|uniref:diguanylate cyclase domain-containing protein n=1 Tax=Alteromonas sp. 5E99-2 TaxID=2817683 RepID=UPI001A99ABEF|nr:diguanylate cyclase [Alteromonas sp. 5E99-2]MBO1254754.1 diguanylate cyclase [Alteromonas sp. 5E99-2]
MNFSLLFSHFRLLTFVVCLFFVGLLLSIGLGEPKSPSDIEWFDVVGEGGITLMTLIWLFFLLLSRPPGRVTLLLVVGLSCFMLSSLIDLLDEFIQYPATMWLSLVESIPAPIGMCLMTWALYQWHQEQVVLNNQLKRREYYYREHTHVDFVTQLNSADYMRDRIQQLLDTRHFDFSLIMLDIDNFNAFNKEYGDEDGDRLLREVSELIIMNIRQTDTACRYAGDRFIILLPHTTNSKARVIAKQIRNAISHLAFKPGQQGDAVFHTLAFAAESPKEKDNTDNLLSRINRQLESQKQFV